MGSKIKNQEIMPMKMMTKMKTPLAFLNLSIPKIEKEVGKKILKNQNIQLQIFLKLNHIKDLIKEIYVNII